MHVQFLNGNVRCDDNVAGDNPYQHFDIMFAKVQVVDEMETKSGKNGINKCNNITNNGYITIRFICIYISILIQIHMNG